MDKLGGNFDTTRKRQSFCPDLIFSQRISPSVALCNGGWMFTDNRLKLSNHGRNYFTNNTLAALKCYAQRLSLVFKIVLYLAISSNLKTAIEFN